MLLDKEVGLEIWKEITEDQTDSRDEAGILSKSLQLVQKSPAAPL